MALKARDKFIASAAIAQQYPSEVDANGYFVSHPETETDQVSDMTAFMKTLNKQGTDAAAVKNLIGVDLSTYAKLASPTFTGTPKAPTASSGTNTTQIATTAFVKTAASAVDMRPDYSSGVAWTYTTVNTEQTYNVTQDGFLAVGLATGVANTNSSKWGYVKVNGEYVICIGGIGSSSGVAYSCIIPVFAGDVLKVNSNSATNTTYMSTWLKFYKKK